MDGKYFYGISGGVFAVVFLVTLVAVIMKKPAWAVSNPDASDKDKKINYTTTILYSLVVAIAITSLVVLVMNMFKKQHEKLGVAAQGTFAVLAAYSITAIILFFSKPKLVLVEGNKEKGLDMMKLNMVALVVAILVGIVDVMLYKKISKKGFESPSASCYSDSETMPAAASSSKYKMSYPMKSSCAY